MVKSINNKNNPQLIKLIKKLKKSSYENNVNIWKDIAIRLGKATKRQASVNVLKFEKYLEDGETAIIPGKLLGNGNINKNVNVAAITFSETAKLKIEKAGGKTLDILELIEQNPTGSGVKIIG